MNIINPTEFKIIEMVKLNHKGNKIGDIVRYKGKYYYLTYRDETMFFIKFAGFGVDNALLKGFIDRKIQTELQRKLGINSRLSGIIIHYKGKKENRYYFADLDSWILDSITYGTDKVSTTNTQIYGIQKILSKKFMTILGYDSDDYQVKQNHEKLTTWKGYG